MAVRPIVAVVGRPNVGKSTLFNKLIGQRLSIVEDTPGVTRDRIYAACEWRSHEIMLVDTGGIEPYSDDIILSQMRRQAEMAIESAQVIVLVVDVKSGVTATDQEVAAMLQKSNKPVVLCVNKCDGVGEVPPEFYEFYNLGLGDPVAVSSVHGHGTGDLLDAVYEHLDFSEEDGYDDDSITVAIVGTAKRGQILAGQPHCRPGGGHRLGHCRHHPRRDRHGGGKRARQICLYRHRRHPPQEQGGGGHRALQRAARLHGHRPLQCLHHHDRRHPTASANRIPRLRATPTSRARPASSRSTSGTRWRTRPTRPCRR